MGHDHHHDHTVSSLNKAFILGITLNVAFVVVEFAVGLYYGSMGLLSDAGHNLSDVASLLLAMLAFRLAQAHATPRYTYGYKKSTVLISLLNSVILLIAVGVIVAESIGRMMHPAPIEGGAIAWTAGVGVAINGFTAWLFMKDKDKDLNVKGAYLHMAADALVSVGVLVSGLVISWTGWTVVDPIVGLVVAAVIVASVWSLTRASLRLSLDGVPDGIRVDELERMMTAVPGVEAVHHIHVWAISTTENALTAHVVLTDLPRLEAVKRGLKPGSTGPACTMRRSNSNWSPRTAAISATDGFADGSAFQITRLRILKIKSGPKRVGFSVRVSTCRNVIRRKVMLQSAGPFQGAGPFQSNGPLLVAGSFLGAGPFQGTGSYPLPPHG